MYMHAPAAYSGMIGLHQGSWGIVYV